MPKPKKVDHVAAQADVVPLSVSDQEQLAAITNKTKRRKLRKRLLRQAQEAAEAKAAQAVAKAAKPSRTVYLGHIPHGFYEKQVNAYFSQFGKVLKVRLARNRRTGAYRGYGFIQFADPDVAAIAAKTMNGYHLFRRILECHVVPTKDIHARTFHGAGKQFLVHKKKHKLSQWERNKPMTKERHDRLRNRLMRKQNQLKKKMAEQGIDYDFDVKDLLTSAAKEVDGIASPPPKKVSRGRPSSKKRAREASEEEDGNAGDAVVPIADGPSAEAATAGKKKAKKSPARAKPAPKTTTKRTRTRSTQPAVAPRRSPRRSARRSAQ